MINFAELKEIAATSHNVTANGVVTREISTEQVVDALLGDAIERTSKLEIDENSGLGRVAGKKLARTFLEQDGDYSFYEFLGFKVQEQAQRIKTAVDSGDAKQINTRIQACVNYCFGIQTIMSTISRNAYYRKLEAERMEEAGHDRRTTRSNDYDGFQNVRFTPDSVVDATHSIYGTYEDLEQSVESLQAYYMAFNMISGGKAVSSTLVAGRELESATGEWVDYLLIDEVWAGLERKRLDRVASLPTRDEAVAAM